MLIEEEHLAHYGVIRRSGRYPWGSGKSENRHNKILLEYISDMEAQGMKPKDIARSLEMSTTDLRAEKSIAKNQQKQANIVMAERLHAKGVSNVEIGRRMNAPESTVRSWLAPGAKDKADVLQSTANMLKSQVDEKGFIDVGSGVERYITTKVDEKGFIDVGTGVENHIGVSSTRLNNAIAVLKQQGYELHQYKVPQLGTGKFTNMKVLGYPGSKQKEIFLDPTKIKHITSFSDDGGRTWYGIHPPIKIDPKRISILYKEDGGGGADGVIYVRPGVKDVDLGASNYAQVRISIGDEHYMKGMAIYKHDLPDGIDLQFNTNKSDTGDKFDALKPNEADVDNPFGSFVRQIVENKGQPEEHVTSAMNIINEEGDWATWSRSLSSQMLSKQSPALAKSQLDMTYERRQNEYEAIKALSNATVRKKLLEEFAEGTAAASVHLKAANLPRQGVHVILPLTNISPNQVYAPRYVTGERVVLIRHPHGGTFEIPDLIVNNKNAEGRKLLGEAPDAIGIHHEVAKRLSGADFDGDTVLVIPNNQDRLIITPALKDLKNFDPQSAYPGYEGMKVMKDTGTQMGLISNLITDMSLQNAPMSEIARAIKHSMVVIDAEKHKLDHKLSANDNNIKELKQKYQTGGASTLISRARSEVRVPQRIDRPMSEGGPVDPVTGERRYKDTGKTSYRTGKPLTTKTTMIEETTDAFTLSSGTRMEALYATHSNKLKAMANEARLMAFNTPRSVYSPSAKKTYAAEVTSLNSKLALAERKRPLERQAQIVAGAQWKAKREANPNMDVDTENKIKYQLLEEQRVRTGSKKHDIKITDREWEAIQAGAISDSKLNSILNSADMDIVRQHATPPIQLVMTQAKTQRAKAMEAMGYSHADIARQLGVSISTVDTAL